MNIAFLLIILQISSKLSQHVSTFKVQMELMDLGINR